MRGKIKEVLLGCKLGEHGELLRKLTTKKYLCLIGFTVILVTAGYLYIRPIKTKEKEEDEEKK